MSEIFYSQAIRDALREEMARDERVLLLGEDIAGYGGAFRVTRGLVEQFGPERIRNTPISENSIVGVAVGSAMLGARPIVEIMFMDFITLAIDQLFNHAAKFRFMFGEQVTLPIVIRTPSGGRRGYGPTHSQSLESLFMSMPGIKIAAPSTPHDAKGMLKSAIRDNNPVLFVENKSLYGTRGEVPDEDYVVPLGSAKVVREGSHVTVISYSQMVQECLRAAQMLERDGVSAEVIDLRTLNPLDMDTLCRSIEKTGRVVLAEEGHRTGGVCAEIGFQLFEKLYYYLDAPIKRVAALDVPVPASPVLEKFVLPDHQDVYEAVKEVLAEV
ncbi:MAG: alpha-ketoacid dehydrogenase subunit beta [Planctomycetes bacterium]|nr:alpha-ketoacid dehydrogenase subunit beta [Planctomycetota bacterium]